MLRSESVINTSRAEIERLGKDMWLYHYYNFYGYVKVYSVGVLIRD
jgi:hypothetical protein